MNDDFQEIAKLVNKISFLKMEKIMREHPVIKHDLLIKIIDIKDIKIMCKFAVINNVSDSSGKYYHLTNKGVRFLDFLIKNDNKMYSSDYVNNLIRNFIIIQTESIKLKDDNLYVNFINCANKNNLFKDDNLNYIETMAHMSELFSAIEE